MSTPYISTQAQSGVVPALQHGALAGVATLTSVAVVTIGTIALTHALPKIGEGVTWAWNGIDEGVSDAWAWTKRQFE